jgi:hypothetical protein
MGVKAPKTLQKTLQSAPSEVRWMENSKSLHKVLRDLLLERLGGRCEICGSTNGLVVHHKDNDRRNNSLSNLQLLCPACHMAIHRHGGSGSYGRRLFLERLGPKTPVYACEKTIKEAYYCRRFVGYEYERDGKRYLGCRGRKPCDLPDLLTLISLPRSQLKRYVNLHRF